MVFQDSAYRFHVNGETKYFLRLAGVIFVIVFSAIISISNVKAQSREFKKTTAYPFPRLMLVYKTVDFSFMDDETAIINLDYKQPVFGISYTFREWRALSRIEIAYGSQSRDAADPNSRKLSVLDMELTSAASYVFKDAKGIRFSGIAPLYIGYRRLSINESPVERNAISAVRMGIGVGLGLNFRPGTKIMSESRAFAMVIMPLDAQQQKEGNSPKWKYKYEAETTIHIEDILGAGYGVSLGAGFRKEKIAVVQSMFFPDSDASWYTFENIEMIFRAGINW